MRSLFDLLDADWVDVCRRSANQTAYRAWRIECPALASCRSLRDLPRWLRPQPPDVTDEVLGYLAGRARVDDLAARTLLQLLQPGCRAAVGRLGYLSADTDEVAAALIAEMYARIRRYPIERRPAQIALNIVWDATRDTRTALSRLQPATPLGDTSEGTPDTPAVPSTDEELLAVLLDAVNAGVLSRADAALVGALRVAGRSATELARRHRCHPGSVRRRRHHAEAVLCRAHRAGQAS